MTEAQNKGFDHAAYKAALQGFDAAVCEACAVSQRTANRQPEIHVAYASYVFTRMCGAAIAMVRAAPLTRWVRSDFDDWQFGAVAGHARSLLDGYLLFSYLIEPAKSEAELKTRINVMHLNDCTRRLELHTNLGNADEVTGFQKHQTELQDRLSGNEFFQALPAAVQKQCLNGRFLMIDSRDAMLAKVGFEKGQFDAIYDLWSQHVHILPISFYRIEPNGRGSGLENETDRSYIAQAMEMCAAVLAEATERMVLQFPDAADARQGLKSEFSPGPPENRPRRVNPARRGIEGAPTPPFTKSVLMAAIKKISMDSVSQFRGRPLFFPAAPHGIRHGAAPDGTAR